MVNTRSISLFFCSALLLAAVGCSQTQQPAPSGGGMSYFPNTVGFTKQFNLTDGKTQITTVESDFELFPLVSVQTFESLCLEPSGAFISKTRSYYAVSESGVNYHGYTYDGTRWMSSEAWNYLVFPLEVGKTWSYIQEGGTKIMTATVAAKETVTVPAGTFECYRVTYAPIPGLNGTTINIWFADNVGQVKSTTNTSTVEVNLSWKSQ